MNCPLSGVGDLFVWFFFFPVYTISDAAQQTRDGSRRRRLGDLCGLLTEARPVPNAADLPGGWEDFPGPEQISNPQGHESRQLPGCFCPLQNQEGD